MLCKSKRNLFCAISHGCGTLHAFSVTLFSQFDQSRHARLSQSMKSTLIGIFSVVRAKYGHGFRHISSRVFCVLCLLGHANLSVDCMSCFDVAINVWRCNFEPIFELINQRFTFILLDCFEFIGVPFCYTSFGNCRLLKIRSVSAITR